MKTLQLVTLALVLFESQASPWRGYGADAYAGMSDIDWAKRYDNWISPAYGYHSMADTDWGWKKRSGDKVEADDQAEEKRTGPLNYDEPNAWKRYFSSYKPIALASRRYVSPIRDRAFGYHSMADLDWGLRKRSFDKRHLGSLAGWRPRGRGY